MAKPTPDEKRNGWTEDTLTQYLEDRHREEENDYDNRPVKKQTRTISKLRRR